HFLLHQFLCSIRKAVPSSRPAFAHVLGNIVSPVGTAPAAALLKRPWAGKPPAFASAERRLIDAFVTGSWEPLCNRQGPQSAVPPWRISGTKKNIEAPLRGLRAITNAVEHEIHAIVVSCALARQHAAASVSVAKTTLH